MKSKIMKSRIMWIMIVVFIVATSTGFFVGRYITIRQNAIYIARELPEHIHVDELKKYRKDMENLKKLIETERENIIIAVKRGEMEEMKDHIDSISKIKREILMQTADQIQKISKTLPPHIREHFIEYRLKVKHKILIPDESDIKERVVEELKDIRIIKKEEK